MTDRPTLKDEDITTSWMRGGNSASNLADPDTTDPDGTDADGTDADSGDSDTKDS